MKSLLVLRPKKAKQQKTRKFRSLQPYFWAFSSLVLPKSFATGEESWICIPLKWSFPNILEIRKHDHKHYSYPASERFERVTMSCGLTPRLLVNLINCATGQTSHGLPWFQLNRQCSIELIVLSLINNSFEFLLFMARESELETVENRSCAISDTGLVWELIACPPPPKLTLRRNFSFCSIYHFCPLK